MSRPEPDFSSPARHCVREAQAYTPGEQPQDAGWIKLNTNENPYPPPLAVIEAIRDALSQDAAGLRKYPDPQSLQLRTAAAQQFGVSPDWVLAANGSDEVLAILLRTFVEAGEAVAMPYPSYTLYRTLAEVHGARCVPVHLDRNWQWPENAAELIADTKLVFCPNPNSPSANLWSRDVLAKLVPKHGLLVLDEAYGSFAEEPHCGEMLRSDFGDRLVVTRTFSKSHSLAGMRIGFCVADPQWIREMDKVRDSYNLDRLAIAAGSAALRDEQWLAENRAKIIATRGRLAAVLSSLGFSVVPSEANFVWCAHSSGSEEEIYERLKEQKVLVRWMRFPQAVPELREGLRISVGTDDEIDSFLEILGQVLAKMER